MGMDAIDLTFINHSNDTNNSSVVIFQKNVPESFGELAIAWKVIRNCGRLNTHPFRYDLHVEACVRDSWGNYSPRMTAYDGQAFEMVQTPSGDVMRLVDTPSRSPTEFEIRNNLTRGAIDALVYRSGRVCAAATNLAPGQKAVFTFHPVIYIGAVSQIQEGVTMDSAIISQINTEINLLGVRSADIVMTGGGPGKDSQPFQFHLENINMAGG